MSVALQCARRSVARTIFHARRGLATTSDAAGQTMSDALTAVHSLLAGESPSSGASPATNHGIMSLPTNPAPSIPSSEHQQSTINIPPAEDPLLHYLTSCIQKHGKRQQASRITARTLLHLHTLTRAPPMPLLRQAIFAISPAVRNITNKHAGRNVVYPVPLSEKQRTRAAVRWLLKASEDRPGQKLEERLAKEIVKILAGKGDDLSSAFRSKEEVHRFAMNNRGNAMRK